MGGAESRPSEKDVVCEIEVHPNILKWLVDQGQENENRSWSQEMYVSNRVKGLLIAAGGVVTGMVGMHIYESWKAKGPSFQDVVGVAKNGKDKAVSRLLEIYSAIKPDFTIVNSSQKDVGKSCIGTPKIFQGLTFDIAAQDIKANLAQKIEHVEEEISQVRCQLDGIKSLLESLVRSPKSENDVASELGFEEVGENNFADRSRQQDSTYLS